MNRIIPFILLFILNAHVIFAQDLSSDVWHNGIIVLKTADTLNGALKYNLEENILQYRYSNKMITLSPNKIISFFFYDELLKSNRYFRSLEYSPYSTYKPELFFEVLVVGELSLLAREYISFETRMLNDPFLTSDPYYNMYPGSGSNYITRRVVNYNFYFFKNDNANSKVIQYKEKKRELYSIMDDHEETIKEYIKNKKVLYNTRKGLMVLTEYYNSLEN
jgi:hypothetical protein